MDLKERHRPRQFDGIGPFRQVSTGHKIYMVPDCTSSQFNVSQEIFQNLDSSDDNYFNEVSVVFAIDSAFCFAYSSLRARSTSPPPSCLTNRSMI